MLALDAHPQSSVEPWWDGNGFSLRERDRRHLRVPVPKMRRCENLKQSPSSGNHSDPYIHEVRHDFRILDRNIVGVVAPSLNRHGPGGLNQPAGECPLAELGGLCGETEEAPFLA